MKEITIKGPTFDVNAVAEVALRCNCSVTHGTSQPAPMSDEEIVKPMEHGFVDIRGVRPTVLELTVHPQANIAAYDVHESPLAANANANREVIRRKADLVRKRILREAGDENWHPQEDCGSYARAFTATPLGGSWDGGWIDPLVVPGWYYFPTPETRDRFFRIMGDELKELL
jgi:hypothetical protein